jgi:hypothetical protein
MAITGVTVTRADETNGVVRTAVVSLVGTAALGPVGPEGAVGPTGATGDTGPAGPIGDSATITVGTVSVGPAAVVNSGTSGEAILDFTLETGATGPTGPVGPASLSLDDVGDVTITSATANDILKWNGSAWVNDTSLLALKAPIASPTFTGTVTLAADPASALQAATKQYVDNVSAGIVAKPSVLGATVSNVTGTYYNGPSDDGVGATLTHDSNGVFPSGAGGASGWGVGKGILLKNQTNKEENGRYFVSNMGSVSTPYVLTRCGYCDEASEIPGAYIFVQDGTYAGTGWIQIVADPATFVVGTDDIDVFQFSGAGTYIAGAGIVLTDNSFSVDTTTIQARVTDVSDTEIGYLNGVTSAIQTQLDAKVAKATLTTTGDTFYASAANTPARLAIGAPATVLTVTGGLPVWAAPAAATWG